MWGGGYNDGSSSVSSGSSSHKILTQSNQNATFEWYPSIVDERRKNVGDDNKAIMGSIETKEFSELGIRQDELVVMWVDNREGNSNAFAGFNLIDVTGMDDEDLEDSIVLAGRSIGTMLTAGDGVTYDGVEVTMRGSGSIYSTSNEHFKPGDLIMYEVPSTDKEKFAAQMAERPAGLRHIGGPEDSKVVLLNRRFRPSMIKDVARFSATRAINEAQSNAYDLHTWREVKSGLQSGKFTDRQSHVIARKTSQLVYGFNLVMQLIRVGFLTPTWDSDYLKPGTNSDHFGQVMAALANVSETNSTQQRIRPFQGANGAPDVRRNTAARADRERQNLQDTAIFFAGILGLAKDPRRFPHLSEQKNKVTNVLTLRNNAGESSNIEHRLALLALVAEDFGVDEINIPKNGIYDRSSGISSQTLMAILNGSGLYTNYQSSIFSRLFKKVFFQATSPSMPGDMIDGFS